MSRCTKHLKYTGRKAPKHECVECLTFHLVVRSAPRAGVMATKVVLSKKAYDRRREKNVDG